MATSEGDLNSQRDSPPDDVDADGNRGAVSIGMPFNVKQTAHIGFNTAMSATSAALQQSRMRRMVRQIERLTAIEPPPGIYDIQAAFTLSLFWSLLGMVPATVFSASVYYNSSIEYFHDGSNRSLPGAAGMAPPRQYYAMTPRTETLLMGLSWAEPFAGPSNFAYFTGGVGIFLMPCMSGDYMPAPMFAVAVFLCILGGASGSFHADGSQPGTWQHVADRFAMFMPFGFLTITMVNALVHAVRGVHQHPRSAVAFLTNILGMTFAIYCLLTQGSINAMVFLVGTGFIIFTLE